MTDNRILQTRIWLKSLFSDYYSGLSKVPEVPELGSREFGFGSFSKKIVVRHRAFKDGRELLGYLKKEAPAHVNHSTARYEFPGADDMEDKNRTGTDLIFDIDAEDLKLDHDHEKGWVCEECFSALKDEARKLVEFLTDDFGFAEKELSVNFSGSRGYHVRLKNEKVLELDDSSRKEICSYLSLDMDMKELIFERQGRIFGPRPEQHGLRGRIARTVIQAVEDSDWDNKGNVADQIRQGNWGAFPKGYGLKRIMEYAKKAAVKIPVDSKVTTDLTHLIRMVDTLHGGSSLLAKTVSSLDDFRPLDDAVVFGNAERGVEFIKKTPEVVANEQTFGPFEKGKAKLPAHLAAYLGAKGRCVVND